MKSGASSKPRPREDDAKGKRVQGNASHSKGTYVPPREHKSLQGNASPSKARQPRRNQRKGIDVKASDRSNPVAARRTQGRCIETEWKRSSRSAHARERPLLRLHPPRRAPEGWCRPAGAAGSLARPAAPGEALLQETWAGLASSPPRPALRCVCILHSQPRRGVAKSSAPCRNKLCTLPQQAPRACV